MTTDIDNDGVDDALMSKRQKQLVKATLVPSEIQKLAPDALIELFELDVSNWYGGDSEFNLFFHAGTNDLYQPVVWRGKRYEALPIEAEGFESTTQGTLPRPTLRLANINGLFSAAVREKDDLVGCKVIRRRTFKRFLDPNNFTIVEKAGSPLTKVTVQYTDDRIFGVDKNIYIDPDKWSSSDINYTVSNRDAEGQRIYDTDDETVTFRSPYDFNPEYDPNQHYPDEVWYVEQKMTETKWLIEWQLSSPLDLNGVQLPRRQIIQNTCCWKYRSAECGYRGSLFYDKDNKPTNSRVDDCCAKRLSSCELRFAGRGDSAIPFGGFPGAVRYDQS